MSDTILLISAVEAAVRSASLRTSHVDKSVVGVGDHAFEVGFGDNRALGEGFFFLRDRKIYFHFFSVC